METLNKLILNNKIVEMRRNVRQSRIHSINKLAKEVKKLKNKKGTDEQKVKNLNKAERYVQEILIMKKINDDTVSKFALLNEKSMTDITNDVTETLQTKALARLVNHRSIVAQIKEFREKFPYWKQTLSALLESLGGKYKNKKDGRNINKTDVDQNKKLNNKNIKTRNKDTRSSNSNVLYNRIGTWVVEDMNIPERVTGENGPNITTKKEKENQYTENILKSRTNEFITENVDHQSVQKFSKNNCNPEEKTNTEGNIEEVSGVVDPFFITKDNKEYISVSVKENYDFSEENNKNIRPHINKYKDKISWSKPKNPTNRKKDLKHHYSNSSKSTFNSNKYEGKKQNDSSLLNLHPSWVAKRKQSSITQFQGTKIKFDDN